MSFTRFGKFMPGMHTATDGFPKKSHSMGPDRTAIKFQSQRVSSEFRE